MRSIPRDWERGVVDPRGLEQWCWRTPTQAVWVRLDLLFAHDQARHQAVVDGLELSGNTRGILLGWKRSSLDGWLAVVNYQINYADGRRQSTIWSEQLVPADALSPREDSIPLS